jgi:NADH:ubiquinone reductase (H+-translocating)
MTVNLDTRKHVVIVGGGFGGLEASKILGQQSNVRVTLIDRRNHHLFQPLLYQVSMAGLSPADIATPIRSIVSGFENTTVLLGEVVRVDFEQSEVVADFGRLTFDYLILACGATHSYFGRDDWEEFAPGLKTLEQATEIRRRVLLSFELAEREIDQEKRKSLLTFVVVGGGATGVELAGSLGEITRFTLSKDFDNIEPASTRIILIEAGPRILTGFDQNLSRRAMRDLEKLGVTVWTDMRVTNINRDGVALGDEVIKADTVIWAAGVKPAAINQTLGAPLDSLGRVMVGKDLSLPNHPNIFSVGDQVRFDDERGEPLPGQAPAAMQQGRHAARNIIRLVSGDKTKNFEFLDKGQMATIGRRRAILQYKNFRLAGILAWWGWLLVHIYYLIGFKNRLFVLIQWGFAYFTWRRGARLVTNPNWRMTAEK